jgi:hypothetical protein
MWKVEEDILSFLRMIAIYGSNEKGDLAVIHQILRAIHTLALPYSYTVALEQRMLSTCLEFFLDNADSIKTSKEEFENFFSDLCELALSQANFFDRFLEQARVARPRGNSRTRLAITPVASGTSSPSTSPRHQKVDSPPDNRSDHTITEVRSGELRGQRSGDLRASGSRDRDLKRPGGEDRNSDIRTPGRGRSGSDLRELKRSSTTAEDRQEERSRGGELGRSGGPQERTRDDRSERSERSEQSDRWDRGSDTGSDKGSERGSEKGSKRTSGGNSGTRSVAETRSGELDPSRRKIQPSPSFKVFYRSLLFFTPLAPFS